MTDHEDYTAPVPASLPLPTGAATEAKQDAEIALLGLIEDLTNALASINADYLKIGADSLPLPTGAATDHWFESIVSDSVQNFELPAGAAELDGNSVPAGKRWLIMHASYQYSGTTPTSITLLAFVSGLAHRLQTTSPIVSGTFYLWSGEIWLGPGDYLYVLIAGASLNDNILMRYTGGQMNI